MTLTNKETGIMASALMSHIDLLKARLKNDELGYMEDVIIEKRIKEAEDLAVRAEDF